MCTCTKSIYLSCRWWHILHLLVRCKVWIFIELYFLHPLHQHLSFSCDTKWVKVAAEDHGGMGEQFTRRYTSLGKAVSQGNSMQVKGNTSHPFSVSTPWAVEHEFTAFNVCSLSFLSMYIIFQYEDLTKAIADFLGFFFSPVLNTKKKMLIGGIIRNWCNNNFSW